MYVEYGFNTHENEDKALDAALAKAAGFTPADLTDNRQGRISNRQMMTLTYKGVVPLLGLIFPFLGVLGLIASFMLFGPWFMTKLFFLLKFGKFIVMGLGAAVLGILAVLANGVIASRRLLLLVVDLATGKSAEAVGRVSVSHSEDIEDGINQILRKRTAMYYFVQGERTFQVSKDAFDELHSLGGAAHLRLHFTPRSHFLLSLEKSSAAAAAAECQERAA